MYHSYGIVKSNLFFLYSNYKKKLYLKTSLGPIYAIKINKEMAFLPLAGQCWIITIPYLYCHTRLHLVMVLNLT